MTDAFAAPGLTDVWTLLVAVVGRGPIQLKVGIALVAILAALMVIDGIRANLARRKPQTIEILREPHARSVPFVVKTQTARPGQRRSLKAASARPSKFSAPRPPIRRVPPASPEGNSYRGADVPSEDPAPRL
jgi:hypothetical protein